MALDERRVAATERTAGAAEVRAKNVGRGKVGDPTKAPMDYLKHADDQYQQAISQLGTADARLGALRRIRVAGVTDVALEKAAEENPGDTALQNIVNGLAANKSDLKARSAALDTAIKEAEDGSSRVRKYADDYEQDSLEYRRRGREMAGMASSSGGGDPIAAPPRAINKAGYNFKDKAGQKQYVIDFAAAQKPAWDANNLTPQQKAAIRATISGG